MIGGSGAHNFGGESGAYTFVGGSGAHNFGGASSVYTFGTSGLQQMPGVTSRHTAQRVQPSRRMGFNYRSRRVPMRPGLPAHLIQEEPNLVVQRQWRRPTNIYGQLVNYNLHYGHHNPMDQIPNLDRRARYDFYSSAENNVGWAQQAYTYAFRTSEGGSFAWDLAGGRRLQRMQGGYERMATHNSFLMHPFRPLPPQEDPRPLHRPWM